MRVEGVGERIPHSSVRSKRFLNTRVSSSVKLRPPGPVLGEIVLQGHGEGRGGGVCVRGEDKGRRHALPQEPPQRPRCRFDSQQAQDSHRRHVEVQHVVVSSALARDADKGALFRLLVPVGQEAPVGVSGLPERYQRLLLRKTRVALAAPRCQQRCRITGQKRTQRRFRSCGC